MKSKISSKQLTYSVSCVIISTSLLSKHIFIYTSQESWISVILGFLISLPVYAIYACLSRRFPGSTLIEINDIVFGRIVGKIFSILYIYIFFTLSCLNTNVFGSFINDLFLPITPLSIINILLIMVCAFAVRKGPMVIMQMSTLFVGFGMLLIIVNTLLLYNMIDIKNYLPLFKIQTRNYLNSAHFIAMIPFCEPFVFFMMIPQLNKSEQFGPAMKRGLLLGAGIYLVITARDIAVLGSAGLELLTYPSLSALRLIDVAEIFTRVEIIYVFILIALMFFKISIFYYAAVSGFSRLVKFKSYKILVFIFGCFIVSYSSLILTSSEHFAWLKSGAASIHSTLFLVLLPAATFIVAVFRGLNMAITVQKN